MKIPAIVHNAEGVTYWTTVDLPFQRINSKRQTTLKQDAIDWGLNQTPEGDRLGRQPLNQSLMDMPYSIHAPRFLVIMDGHREIASGYDPIKKQYTGESRRFGAGEFFYIYGMGGHRPSGVSQALPLTFPGLGKWNGKDGKPVGVFK